MIYDILIPTLTALLLALLIYMFSKRFEIGTDDSVERIEALLPGVNCGGCGYPSCHALAEAISKDNSLANRCVVGGKAVTEKICSLLNINVDAEKRKIAVVKCMGGLNAASDCNYSGEKECRIAVFSNPKTCTYGCLGYGDCEQACVFDAIAVGKDEYAVVDPKNCTACNKCVEACPLNIIELLPEDTLVYVACSSQDTAKETAKKCKYGCIACGACVKVCPVGAITITNNLAYIDQEKCIKCGKCAEVCPRKVIVKTR